MNFFAQQEKARSQTRRMLILFIVAVICIVAAVDLVVAIAIGLGGSDNRHVAPAALHPNSGALVASTLVVLAIIGVSMLYKISSLRAGGGVVARELGATLVDLNDPQMAANFAYKRLHNVVEEIAIASGVPVPQVYVLENETSINAFASGYTPSDAAVTVTRGTLERLNREELQGVIAHEFSHVLNGDMRLNIRLMGVLFGIIVIAIVGRKMIEWSGRDRDSGWQVALGIAILIVGSIGAVLRPAHQGGHFAAARISRRRIGRAVHAPGTRNLGRAEKDQWASGRLEAVGQGRRGSRSHAVRRWRRLFRPVRHAPAAARAHPRDRARFRSARTRTDREDHERARIGAERG